MIVGAPLDKLGIDILCPFPENESSNTCEYILAVTDGFTKLEAIFPLSDKKICASVMKYLLDIPALVTCTVIKEKRPPILFMLGKEVREPTDVMFGASTQV